MYMVILHTSRTFTENTKKINKISVQKLCFLQVEAVSLTKCDGTLNGNHLRQV